MAAFTLTERFGDSLVLDTKFGKLVCWKVRDDEEYKEFSIDLIANDGKEYQVATIGTDEHGFYESPFLSKECIEKLRKRHASIHTYLWDGNGEDSCESFFMDPHGDGYYYDPKEEE